MPPADTAQFTPDVIVPDGFARLSHKAPEISGTAQALSPPFRQEAGKTNASPWPLWQPTVQRISTSELECCEKAGNCYRITPCWLTLTLSVIRLRQNALYHQAGPSHDA